MRWLAPSLGLLVCLATAWLPSACGSSCPPDGADCYTLVQLRTQRDTALGSSAGGQGGEGGQATSSGASSSLLQLAASWDPASGCPSGQQLDAIETLNGYDSLDEYVLTSDKDSECCYRVVYYCP